MAEFVIRAEGDPSDAIDDPNDLVEWPVDEPIDSQHWHIYAIWVERAFSCDRLANAVALPPARSGVHEPDECVNFVAYREWLIEHCPGAKFVCNIETAGSYDWIKIVFASHIEAVDHRMWWEGPGSVSG